MPPPDAPPSLFADRALLPGGWAKDVAIDMDGQGRIAAVTPNADGAGREKVAGPLVPAMPNLHSHAFQYAMAGLAETAGATEDTFWTWRETMYGLVGRVSPDDVEAIAARLYIDLLKSGYGAVAEFHYLHHDRNGAPFADRAEMAHRILAAARTSGIGLTLVPTFYAHGNFGGQPPTPGQARFVKDVDAFLKLHESLEGPCMAAGAALALAFHSLRAATPGEMRAILAATRTERPIHIHVAEQQREVDDSLAWDGRRPITALLDDMPVDDRWCLIHATHAAPAEVVRIAASGAVVGLCPTTEANLGDGIFPALEFQAHGGRFGIGTDSHVSTSPTEDLRQLEYSQRLRDERRQRLAGGPGRSVGRTLYDTALAAGAQALGQRLGAVAPGHVASLVVLDAANPMIGLAQGDAILDRWLFAVGDRAVRDVMVAGRWRVREGRHPADAAVDRAFAAALARLGAAA